MRTLSGAILSLAIIAIPNALSAIPDTGESGITVSGIDYGIKTEGGAMVWRDGRWVAEEGTGVKGFLKFGVAVDSGEHAVDGRITGQTTLGKGTVYQCEGGHMVYLVGSPTGAIPMKKKSLIDPGMLAPVVTAADLLKLDRADAVERLHDADEATRDAAGWDLWKIAVGEEVDRVLESLKTSDNKDSQVATVQRLGYLYHPHITPALKDATQSSDKNLAKSAREAIARLGASPGSPTMSVAEAQKRLIELGYDPGPADGMAGPKTVRAIRAFQTMSGLEPTGKLDQKTADKLKGTD